jgi:hypothetical protein
VSCGCGVSEINKGFFLTEIKLHLDADAKHWRNWVWGVTVPLNSPDI